MARVTTIVFALGVLAAGCGLSARDIAFVERDDVVLAVPTARAGIDAMRGEAHTLVTDTSAAIDGWLGPLVDDTAGVVATLEDHRETRRDGAFRLYGPFADPDDRDVTWLVKLAEHDDATTFELWVGPQDADEGDVELAVHGHLAVAADRRSGDLTLELDVLDRYPRLRPDGERITGAVTVLFERAREAGSARVELRFTDVVREADAGTWRADDTIVHARDAEGGGSLHAVFQIDDEGAMDGVLGELQVTQIDLDARWDPSAAGRIRARAPRSANPDSALSHGDLLLHECFAPAGGLTFRELNEPYAADRPTYGLGSATTCVFADADLDPD